MSKNQNTPSPIISALKKWVKGGNSSAEELYRMQQFGFIFPDENGQLQLTLSGKQTLEEFNLA